MNVTQLYELLHNIMIWKCFSPKISLCSNCQKFRRGFCVFSVFDRADIGTRVKETEKGEGREESFLSFLFPPPPPLLSSQRSRVQPRPQKTSTETLASQATPRSITFILFQTRPVVISSFLFGQIAFGLNSLITSFIFCLLFVA